MCLFGGDANDMHTNSSSTNAAVPQGDISLMYEKTEEPGLLYFHVIGELDSDIENVHCTVQGFPGTCYLDCFTQDNSYPDATGPFDGYTYVLILRIS